jgi:C4-type Zn-finger protein
MPNPTLKNTAEMLTLAEGIVNRFGEIAKIVHRFETEENYNSLAAIEAVAKIVKGEVHHG